MHLSPVGYRTAKIALASCRSVVALECPRASETGVECNLDRPRRGSPKMVRCRQKIPRTLRTMKETTWTTNTSRPSRTAPRTNPVAPFAKSKPEWAQAPSIWPDHRPPAKKQAIKIIKPPTRSTMFRGRRMVCQRISHPVNSPSPQGNFTCNESRWVYRQNGFATWAGAPQALGSGTDRKSDAATPK